MKIKRTIGFLTAAAILLAFNKALTGEDVVKIMFTRYAGKWHRTLTFDQKTERYRNDSLVSTQNWHEVMLAPDKLRIDIAPYQNGNSIIFRGDSTYNIRNGNLRSAVKDENDLIFLLGGLYFYKQPDALNKLKMLGYDLNKAYETEWKGRSVYVIGAGDKNDLSSNQLWVDKANLILLRLIENGKQGREEAIFEDQVKVGGGWSETKVHFYINGKLLQVESYINCASPGSLSEQLFDPQHYERWQPQ